MNKNYFLKYVIMLQYYFYNQSLDSFNFKFSFVNYTKYVVYVNFKNIYMKILKNKNNGKETCISVGYIK